MLLEEFLHLRREVTKTLRGIGEILVGIGLRLGRLANSDADNRWADLLHQVSKVGSLCRLDLGLGEGCRKSGVIAEQGIAGRKGSSEQKPKGSSDQGLSLQRAPMPREGRLFHEVCVSHFVSVRGC